MRRGDIDIVRLAALSDGIFAVAMTVLVAALPFAPHLQQQDTRAFRDALLALLPQLRAAGISFFVAALYWWRHHDMLAMLARGTATLAWLNFVLLFGIVLVPFATRLLGDYPANPITVDLYAGTLAVIGVALGAMWFYVMRHPELLRPEASPARIRRGVFGVARSLPVFLLCMALAWVDAGAALWSLLLLIPALWLARPGA